VWQRGIIVATFQRLAVDELSVVGALEHVVAHPPHPPFEKAVVHIECSHDAETERDRAMQRTTRWKKTRELVSKTRGHTAGRTINMGKEAG
jgi:hypothetical protein